MVKSVKIPKGYSEAAYQRADNTMVKSVKIPKGNQKPQIKEQTIQ
jgi:hypothetical protein